MAKEGEKSRVPDDIIWALPTHVVEVSIFACRLSSHYKFLLILRSFSMKCEKDKECITYTARLKNLVMKNATSRHIQCTKWV